MPLAATVLESAAALAAAELRAKHLVAYQRGRLRVLDWAGLEAVAQGVAPPNHNAARV